MQNNQRETLISNPFSGMVFGMLIGAGVGLVYALVLNVQPVMGVSVAAGIGLAASLVISMVNPDTDED